MTGFKSVFIFILPFLFLFQANSSHLRSNAARIVGGASANAGQFPFSAAIYVQTATSTFFCGGSLIDHLWIVTAAHCAEGATLFTIRLGSNSLSSTDSNRVTAATSHYVVHPEFNPNTLEHNIALIRLRIAVQFTDYIRPIELTSRDTQIYNHFTAIGWGQLSDTDAELSDHLQFVSLITISNDECMNVFGYQISSDMVCATGNYNEGTCLGDTGSALVEHIYNPQGLRLAGVASFISGDGCDHPHPSGYTRVYIYLDWIADVIANDVFLK